MELLLPVLASRMGGMRAGWVGFAPCCGPTIWDGTWLERRVSESMTNLMNALPPDLLPSSFSYRTDLGRVVLGNPAYLLQQTKSLICQKKRFLEKV